MGRKVLPVRLSVPDLRIEILPLPTLRGFLAREVVGEAEEKEGGRPAEQSIGGLAVHFTFTRAVFLSVRELSTIERNKGMFACD